MAVKMERERERERERVCTEVATTNAYVPIRLGFPNPGHFAQIRVLGFEDVKPTFRV